MTSKIIIIIKYPTKAILITTIIILIKTPSFIKKTNNSNTNYDVNQQRSNNYQPSNTSNIKEYTRFSLEKELIDDILRPTGIKIKPDEKIMVDFC